MTLTEIADQMRAVASMPDTPEGARPWLQQMAQGILNETAVSEATAINPAYVKGAPMPVGIGEQADLYAEVRQVRLDMQKDVDAVKARETEIYKAIMSTLEESTDTGASGKHHRVQRVMKTSQTVKDWDAFYSFVQQTGELGMLQRRLSDKAVEEWAESKGDLPAGVEATEYATLSFSKI